MFDRIIMRQTWWQTSFQGEKSFFYVQHIEHIDGIAAVRDAYMNYKLERGLIDYDDVLEYLSILLSDEQIGPQIRASWDYVMIDEYQDVNALQVELVYNLATETRNIMIVGDPSQSIFALRFFVIKTHKLNNL